MNPFSRRRLLKIGASLFAFVPAIGYLMSTPKAWAFAPCDNEEFIVCVFYELECANYDCELQNHWYRVEECYDTRLGRTGEGICYYTFTNTGQPC
jgi:hypothetical protein